MHEGKALGIALEKSFKHEGPRRIAFGIKALNMKVHTVRAANTGGMPGILAWFNHRV